MVDGVADAGGPYTIDEGGDLPSTARRRSPEPATFSWDVNDDGTFGDATGATPTLTWAQLEALGITDGTPTSRHPDRHHTAAHRWHRRSPPITALTVTNVAPTATFGNDGPVAEVDGDGDVLRPSDPSADDLAALTYSYDFDNDGIFEVIGSPSPSATVPASSWPMARRRVTVRGVVADDDGGSLELTTDITSPTPPPRSPSTGRRRRRSGCR